MTNRYYAWGEVHVLVGILIGWQCLDHPWKLAVAIPLAIASHWPLDDLNTGEFARIFHGIGKGWVKIASSVTRIPVWAAILYFFWRDPLLMATGLIAWLCLDHEWILNLFGRHGYGLHKRMWPAWLKDHRALLPWFLVIYFLVVLFV